MRERFSGITAIANPLLLGLCLLTVGCQTKPSTNAASCPSTDRSPSVSVSAGTACPSYAREVCAKAGEDTATCAGFKSAVELMPERACSAGLEDLAQSLDKLATLRQPCNQLRDELCNSFGSGSELCDFVTVQTRMFPVEQCTNMLGSLPNVVEDLKQLQAAKKPLTQDLVAAISAGDGPGFGQAGAKVEIVEFSDFECPYCQQAARVMQTIRERYGDKVHFVFRQYPLPIHENAGLAAKASLAAHAQGKFWEFHDRAFRNEGTLDRSALERIAKEAGMDLARFNAQLAEPSVEQAVESDIQLGKHIQIEGTPALYINGRRVEHPTDLTTVINAIERVQREPS